MARYWTPILASESMDHSVSVAAIIRYYAKVHITGTSEWRLDSLPPLPKQAECTTSNGSALLWTSLRCLK